MKKFYTLAVIATLMMTAIVGCKSDDDDSALSHISKVTIINPDGGIAENMGAWIPATGSARKKLLLEEGQYYRLGVLCQPSSLASIVNWSTRNSAFEEAMVTEQGIVSGLREDLDDSNVCWVIAAGLPTIADTVEVMVKKELSGVYQITARDRDIVIPDGGSIRSTVAVTSASNASGKLENQNLITAFFSDKNRANFNDAVTQTFVSGTAFDIQANGPGVNILLAFSKATMRSKTGEMVSFDHVRDYAVLTSTSKRQALQVDSSYVSLSQHNVHLRNGETVQLTAQLICPNNTKPTDIRYASSNTAVATVDQTGKVTAVGRGIASITAYTNHLVEGQECIINVEETTPVAVTRIADTNNFTNTHTITRCLIVEGQTKQLYSDSHRNEMDAASGTIWHSTNENVVTVDANGLAKAVGRGTAIVYATPYVDKNGTNVEGISDCSCFTVMPDYTKVKLGDIFYSDGSFSNNLESGKTPIGIVAYLNCDASSNPVIGSSALTETAELGQYGAIGTEKNFHGLVISLKNSATGVKWGKDATATNLMGVTVASDDASMKGNATANNYSGFNAAIYTNAEDVITGAPTFVPSESYPASYAAWHYGVKVPSYVTNWFMPTTPQWYAVLYNGLGGVYKEGKTITWNQYFDNTNAFTNINNALKKLQNGGFNVDLLPTTALFWTANEGDTNGTTAAAMLVNSNGLKFQAVSKTITAGEGSEPTVARTFFAF